ncbi:MAG: sodium:alanine symporter family protein [Eubacteriales bacterium]|nr:sodium:alanine symporter family protein [Eubacteriales bacterium]MDY5674925.1 sodium:alanine symporter family protein [Eubacteriales bacterium]MDY5801820.1 sodium:alanine symporter family protein [Eubacteriales bacterium]
MELIVKVNSFLNGIVWGWPCLILLVGTGVYYTIRCGGVQFKWFGYIMKNTIGKIFEKKEAGEGAVTPFQAVCTALAATVGTGNIAGITGAIALGGPGAVFWMWISALFGMCTKFAEVTLAIHFRERNDKGDWVGGPMYYISKGLGKNWKWLGSLFALFGMLAAFGIGNMTQINSIVTSISGTINSFTPINVNTANLIIGIIVAIFCAIVLIGGLKRIGQVTEKLVPFMAVIYILSALIIFFAHIGNIGNVLRSIFVGAFTPSAVVGGAAGITISAAVKRGVGRGVFSNEAGLGSAPIAHAAADTDSAVRQGCFGVFEVFADTIVICTLTAFAVLMSGTPINFGQAAGADLTIAAFGTTFGRVGGIIISVGLTLFATSTILSWCLYGTRCAEFLFKTTKIIKPYQVIFCLIIVLGAVTELSLVWDIADTLNGLMALPNLVGLLALSPIVIKLTREYFNGVRLGESNRK